jgi:hypothetical protein
MPRQDAASTAVLEDRADKLTSEVERLRKGILKKPKDKGLQALLAASERRLAWYESRLPSRKRKRTRLTDLALGKVRL